MLIRMLLLAFIFFITGPVTVNGQEKTARHGLIALEDFDCLPVSDFGLSKIRLRMPQADVLKRLGKPMSKTKDWGEDDGGRYDVVKYHYATLTVDIVRGEVDRIHTNSPKQKTPEQIRVGDSRDAVVKKLGATPRDWKRDQSQVSIVTCPENTQGGQLFREDYVTYEFGVDARLKSITYEVNRP